MRILKIALPIFAFLFVLNVSAQKVKLKKGDVLVDGNSWLTYDGCGMFSPTCSLYNSEGGEIIFLKWISVPGVEPVTASNKDGSLGYMEIVFLGTDKKYEIQKTYKKTILDLFKAKVVNEDGSLSDEKIDKLIEKFGTPFSDRLNNSSTIIINESSSSRSNGSGVNINIQN